MFSTNAQIIPVQNFFDVFYTTETHRNLADILAKKLQIMVVSVK